MKSTERTTWWTNQNIWRAAVVFATAVVAIHVLLAVVGLKEGTSFFDRGVDPDSMFREHWLADLAAAQTNWSALGIGVLTLAAIAAMQLEAAGPWRPLLLAWGWAVCTFLTLVLPGNLSLYLVPMLLPLALYRVGWPEMSIIVLAGTGFVLGLMTLRYGRKTGGGCPVCGRRSPTAHPPRFARFATLAAYAAALAPLGYASVRLLWASGVPAGTSAQFLQRINDANPGHGTVLMELTLAGMAMGGGVLCWGLTRPWSRTWPRWIPTLRGQAIPRWFPVGLGLVCGAGLSGYATMLIPSVVRFVLGQRMTFPGTEVPMTLVSHVPAISLILWAPLIVLASIAYGYRTGPMCRTNGQSRRRRTPSSMRGPLGSDGRGGPGAHGTGSR